MNKQYIGTELASTEKSAGTYLFVAKSTLNTSEKNNCQICEKCL